jgi:hypothetical protein
MEAEQKLLRFFCALNLGQFDHDEEQQTRISDRSQDFSCDTG